MQKTISGNNGYLVLDDGIWVVDLGSWHRRTGVGR